MDGLLMISKSMFKRNTGGGTTPHIVVDYLTVSRQRNEICRSSITGIWRELSFRYSKWSIKQGFAKMHGLGISWH